MRLILALFALVISALAAQADDLPLMGVGTPFKQAAVGYTGPGDVVSGATAWYGLRAYSAAKAGGKSVNIRRTSDGTNTDINTLANGNFDTSTATSFCNATTCFVTTFYDQTQNLACAASTTCDLVQGTAAKQPQLIFNCVNTSLPCVQFTTNTMALTSANSFTPATGALTHSSVFNLGNGTFFFNENGGTTISGNKILHSAANTIVLRTAGAGGTSGTATDGSWHAVNGAVNGASTALNIDGTETTGTTTGNTIGSFPNIALVTSSVTSDVGEYGFWDNTVFTGTQRTNMCHNQFTYWATSTSC